MPGKFLHDLCRSLAVGKKRNIVVSQTVKKYLIAFPVIQFDFRYLQILSDKLCRVNPLAEGHKDPIVSVWPHTGFQCRQNANQYRRDRLLSFLPVLGYRSFDFDRSIIRRQAYSVPR